MSEANLTVSVEALPIEGKDDATLIVAQGSIDAQTYRGYQDYLMPFTEGENKQLVLDLGGIAYVNSTGMGLLVKIADALRTNNGEMYIINLTPDVHGLFDMLGLLCFFRTFDSIDECVEAIKNPIVEEDEEQITAIYPKRIKCKECGSALNIVEMGKFVCPVCETYLSADENGNVTAHKPREAELIKITLPLKLNWSSSLMHVAASLCENNGFDKEVTSSVARAIDEAWTAITSQEGVQGNCHCVLIGNSETLIMGFVLYNNNGASLGEGGGSSMALKVLSTYVDDVQFQSLPGDTQVLRLVKKNFNAAKAIEVSV